MRKLWIAGLSVTRGPSAEGSPGPHLISTWLFLGSSGSGSSAIQRLASPPACSCATRSRQLHVHRFVVDADDARTRMAAKTMAPVAHDAPNQVRTQGTAYWTVAFCRASGSCLPKMTPSTRRLPSECSQSSFDLAFILLLMGDNCGVTSARLAAGGRA